jgi:alkylated DNA repair dioxygenase AlkB
MDFKKRKIKNQVKKPNVFRSRNLYRGQKSARNQEIRGRKSARNQEQEIKNLPVEFSKNQFPEVKFEDLHEELGQFLQTGTVFNGQHKTPRKEGVIGFHSGFTGYHYSGHDVPPIDLKNAPIVNGIFEKVKSLYPDLSFKYVLCNLYRNGSDYVSWHCDKGEKTIVSLSFGRERKFSIRDNKTKKVVNFMLPHGSMITMIDCQKTHQHTLRKVVDTLKNTRNGKMRINLTFRSQ